MAPLILCSALICWAIMQKLTSYIYTLSPWFILQSTARMRSSWTSLGPPVSQDRIITSFPKVQSWEHLCCCFLFPRGLGCFDKRSWLFWTSLKFTKYPRLALNVQSSCLQCWDDRSVPPSPALFVSWCNPSAISIFVNMPSPPEIKTTSLKVGFVLENLEGWVLSCSKQASSDNRELYGMEVTSHLNSPRGTSWCCL